MPDRRPGRGRTASTAPASIQNLSSWSLPRPLVTTLRQELAARLAFPIRDGIPIMLEEERGSWTRTSCVR